MQSGGEPLPLITKRVCGRDVSRLGAFPAGSVIDLEISSPRRLAVSGIVLRIRRDTAAPGEEQLDGTDTDLPFGLASTDFKTDVYRLSLDTSAICDGTGLFYYEFLFLRGFDTLFSSAVSNCSLTLSREEGKRFSLLLYERDFKTPDCSGAVMYHIFIDRFFKGRGRTEYHPGAKMHASLSEEPEYAAVRGGYIANNDFFGGNLYGVTEKLDYLESLGVSMIYLSPVFDSPSNHKYDTSDYNKIDEGFGGIDAFTELLSEARKRGIKVILDGVFNHTGSDSIYFDKNGRYGSPASNPGSAYHSWYRFGDEYKNGYEAWWDIDILPRLNTGNDAVDSFFTSPGGICEKYIKMGASGWRLDVADELPDAFLGHLRATVKAVDPEAIIIGEVWENAADKIAYGKRRSYFRGLELDSVMNYPLKNALLRFGGYGDAEGLADTLTELYATYPETVSGSLMNIIGTHDTGRALSFLGAPDKVSSYDGEQSNEKLAAVKLGKEELETGIKRLKAVSVIQYTVYGFPCVFYGDETGLEGMTDPFCRRPLRWDGSENRELLEHYRMLGRIRKEESCLFGGDFAVTRAEDGYIEFVRTKGKRRLTVAVNCGSTPVKCNACGKELTRGKTVRGITLGSLEYALIASGAE